MVAKQKMNVINKAAGQRGRNIIAGGRKAASGGKGIVQGVKTGNVEQVISGSRKFASGVKKAALPSQKLAEGVARKGKRTVAKIKKLFK